MDKEVILILIGKSQYGSLNFFVEEIAREFRKKEYEIIYLPLSDEEETINQILATKGKPVKGIFGFNGVGIDLRFNGQRLTELFNTTLYSLFVDHPMYHADRHELVNNDNVGFFVDKNHVDYARKIYKYKHVDFLPLGGTLQSDFAPIKERTKSIAFFGSYISPETIHENIEKIKSDINKTINYTIINNMIDNNVDVNAGLDMVISSLQIECSMEEYSQTLNLASYADKYVRNYNRYKVIKTLLSNGISVDCYGSGWENFECSEQEKQFLCIKEQVDFSKSLELMKEYKIILNVMPCFMNGGHDRILNSLLAGAVCLTDKSIYVTEEFDENSIVFYDINNIATLPKIIKELLSSDDRMNEIAKSGQLFCQKNHLWKNRVDFILELMDKIK